MATSRRRIWLLTVGEPLPMGAVRERPLRVGLLADTLVERGHDVLWWTSTFDHSHKRQAVAGEQRVQVREGYALELLHAMSYPSNLSLRRFVSHIQVARGFTRKSASLQPPDVMLCSLPTIELAAAGVAFARRARVPVIVDVRDLWPDAIYDLAPRPGRPLARLLLEPWYSAARHALAGADALTAVSQAYLDWGLRRAGRAAGPRDRIFPLGYPRHSALADARSAAGRALAERGVDASKRLAWFVGMLGRTYDLSCVIAAARRLAAAGALDVQFVLSGTGDQETKWRAEAAGLPNVVFTGWVNSAEIAWLLDAAWVGLAAYARGAPQVLPNKPFEYMSGGLPVLSSLGGETQDMLSRCGCGLTYPAGDAGALAEAILSLRSDPDRHRALGAAGRAAYEREFAADVVYARMAEWVAAGAPPAVTAHDS